MFIYIYHHVLVFIFWAVLKRYRAQHRLNLIAMNHILQQVFHFFADKCIFQKSLPVLIDNSRTFPASASRFHGINVFIFCQMVDKRWFSVND